MSADLLKTPLHALHVELGARMVPFAGYDMPVNYPGGIIAEHKQCRESAALFDVSHMGQVRLLGDDAARALETLVPVEEVVPGERVLVRPGERIPVGTDKVVVGYDVTYRYQGDRLANVRQVTVPVMRCWSLTGACFFTCTSSQRSCGVSTVSITSCTATTSATLGWVSVR